jgi:hypothetical protein
VVAPDHGLGRPAHPQPFGNRAPIRSGHGRDTHPRARALRELLDDAGRDDRDDLVACYRAYRALPIDLHIRLKTGCAARAKKIADVIRVLIEREFLPQS